jgi:hypothetical protein
MCGGKVYEADRLDISSRNKSVGSALLLHIVLDLDLPPAIEITQ